MKFTRVGYILVEKTNNNNIFELNLIQYFVRNFQNDSRAQEIRYCWSGSHVPEQRHFSMSEGTYQWLGELQFFRKLTPPIIFWGVSASIVHPISESQEGFLSPTRLDFSLTFLTQKIKFINAALGIYMQYKYSGAAQWNGVETRNSKGSVITPGFGLIWTTQNKLGIALNILFPKLLTGNLAMIESEPNQNLNAAQLSLGVRKTFDYIIPFLE